MQNRPNIIAETQDNNTCHVGCLRGYFMRLVYIRGPEEAADFL